MATEFVGMKEFRQHLSAYAIKVRKKNARLIILKKNKPILEVRALREKTQSLERLARDVSAARQDVMRKRVYTQKQIMEEYGLL